MKESTKSWLIIAVWGVASTLLGLLALFSDHPVAWFAGGAAYLRFQYLVWTTPMPGYEEFTATPVFVWANLTLILLIIPFAVPSHWASIPVIMSFAMLIFELFRPKNNNHEDT